MFHGQILDVDSGLNGHNDISCIFLKVKVCKK
jgi:hypothetical protein